MTQEQEARIQEELGPVAVEELYDAMLDDCYGPTQIAGLEYNTSYALREVDPTAYRCGKNDYVDSLDLVEINGEYYDTDEVQEILDEMEDG